MNQKKSARFNVQQTLVTKLCRSKPGTVQHLRESSCRHPLLHRSPHRPPGINRIVGESSTRVRTRRSVITINLQKCLNIDISPPTTLETKKKTRVFFQGLECSTRACGVVITVIEYIKPAISGSDHQICRPGRNDRVTPHVFFVSQKLTARKRLLGRHAP